MERIVPSTIRALTNNETMVCRSPDEVRDYLFVEDVADALANLLDSDVGGPVNIGSGNGVSNRKLMLEIADQLQRKELVRFASAAGSTVVADIRRLNNEVGWKPHINLAEGIARSIARVRESIGVS
jgi:nucleoside-diphosphate-sugar epimerase